MRHPTELDEPLVAICLSGLCFFFFLGGGGGEVEVGINIPYCLVHKY